MLLRPLPFCAHKVVPLRALLQKTPKNVKKREKIRKNPKKTEKITKNAKKRKRPIIKLPFNTVR
jgi:hypothetical protein